MEQAAGTLETKDRIVEAAQGLFFTQGYEGTSVAEIIKAVAIAKGTFYHHFGSKSDLLDEIVHRFTRDMLSALEPILEDTSLSALEKLRLYLVRGFSWKVQDRERFYMLLNALYTDENLLLRKKMSDRSVRIMSPILARIVNQGVREGVFETPIPDRAGELALRLANALGEEAAELFRRLPDEPEAVSRIDAIFAEVEYGMERLIGAPPGTILMVDRGDLYAMAGRRAEKEGRA
ncbi:MAG: TetR/AcrR family transcriptional regulator [Alkalispirochaetaceae bacterium]